MTDSDRQMDRGLRGLSTLQPTRSVWPELEKQIARRERQSRRRYLFRFSAPAVAASLMLALLILNNFDRQAEQEILLQKTVENAVKNARPQATFSNLEIADGDYRVEALLVAAKPRRAEAVYAAETSTDSESETELKKQDIKEINEF